MEGTLLVSQCRFPVEEKSKYLSKFGYDSLWKILRYEKYIDEAQWIRL